MQGGKISGKKISLFHIKEEDIKRIVLANYGLIFVEGLFAFFINLKYGVWPWSVVFYIIFSIMIINLLLHLFLMTKASLLVKELILILLAIVVVAGLTVAIHYLPEARPALLLVYVPTIIFSATQSLSFGILNLLLILISFGALMLLEIYKLLPFQTSDVNIASMGPYWTISVMFSLLFIMILSFLINYFIEILRRRQAEIQKLAEINEKLYQRSKTTSDEIIKNMNEGLVVVDGHYKIVRYNDAFKKMIGFQNEVTNTDIGELPIVFSARLKTYLQHMIKDKINSFSFKAQNKLKQVFLINIMTINLNEKEKGFLILLDKKSLPWGTVFDSVTKAPIEMAVVQLHQAANRKILETKATDKNGRFGFIVPEGEYYLTVSKRAIVFLQKVKLTAIMVRNLLLLNQKKLILN